MDDKIFRIAIIVSLSVHCVFLIRFFIAKEKTTLWQQAPVLSYLIEESKEVKEKPPVWVEKAKPHLLKETLDIPGVESVLIEKDMIKASSELGDSFKVFDRKPTKIKGEKPLREVVIPMMRSEKINTPSYTTYYQVVRERIRERAYANYTRLSSGEVYLTFIIRQNGVLTELQILADKTTANDFLKQVGMRSVQEAAPFPPFPQDLNFPELTFNIAISFQYKE